VNATISFAPFKGKEITGDLTDKQNRSMPGVKTIDVNDIRSGNIFPLLSCRGAGHIEISIQGLDNRYFLHSFFIREYISYSFEKTFCYY